jgi:hypothetical protein
MAETNNCGRLHALLEEQCKRVAAETRVLGDECCATALFSAPNVRDSVQQRIDRIKSHVRRCPATIGERTAGDDQKRESHDAPGWERTESALSSGGTPKSESPHSIPGVDPAAAELRVTPAVMAFQDMDRFSSFVQSHYLRKSAEHDLDRSLAPMKHMAQCAHDQQLRVRRSRRCVDHDDDDCGVGTCLPGFRRVQRRWGWNEDWGEMLSPPRLLSLENARSEMARRASAALCYSTELIKSQGGLARESLCSVFRRSKSADELDQEKLMELFLHAVEVGSVKISRQEDEPAFQ